MTKAERNRRDRALNLEAGLCRCGRERPATSLTCDGCRAWDAGRRARAKAAGLCTWCRKRKARKGKRGCLSCAERYNRERREAMALYRAVQRSRP